MNQADERNGRRFALGGLVTCLLVVGCGGKLDGDLVSGATGGTTSQFGNSGGGGAGLTGTTTGGSTTTGTPPWWSDDAAVAKAMCDSLVAKYTQCSLITSGSEILCPTSISVTEACLGNCTIAAKCEDLKSFVCESTIWAFLESCRADCVQLSVFSCTNGETVPLDWRCDDDDDCEDASDEADCPVFTCNSGETILPMYRCDLGEQCADGSDETDCPVFTCDSGEGIYPAWRCNGSNECADGSDERGCAQFACGQ